MTPEEMLELVSDVALDPELAECIVETTHGFIFVKHPLVNTLYMPGVEHKRLNAALAYKRKALAEAKAAKQWHSFIYLHERPWRLEALQEIAPDMTDQEFWEKVTSVWMDSENIRECYQAWDRLLRIDRHGRNFMMDDDERAFLAKLPKVLTVWQGHTVERDDGWSWTLNKDKAEWFAHRFARLEDSEPVLTEGRVYRNDVVAYLTSRGEDEILVAPEDVDILFSVVL